MSVPQKLEVDVNNLLHPLHPSNGDLRIIPEGWEPPKDETNPLLHHDLRILEAPAELE